MARKQYTHEELRREVTEVSCQLVRALDAALQFDVFMTLDHPETSAAPGERLRLIGSHLGQAVRFLGPVLAEWKRAEKRGKAATKSAPSWRASKSALRVPGKGKPCPDCNGGISYTDSRGNTDHMNAHSCEKCSGTGRVDKRAHK